MMSVSLVSQSVPRCPESDMRDRLSQKCLMVSQSGRRDTGTP